MAEGSPGLDGVFEMTGSIDFFGLKNHKILN